MRRAAELSALIILVPALLTTWWFDDSHLSGARNQHVTVVKHGTTGTLDHDQWRMIGRGPNDSGATAPGGVRLTLVVEVRALSAQGAADAEHVGFQLRDKAGHVWMALGTLPGGHGPAAGATERVTVTGEVPTRLAGSVVLELGRELSAPQGPPRLLRFAH